MIIALSVLAALVLDALLGEPRHYHPLIGFGRLARIVEAKCHGQSNSSPSQQRLRGAFGITLLIAPFVLLAAGLAILSPIVGVVILYLAIGWKSLGDHALRVRDALRENDLTAARRNVGMMVSRDTASMEVTDVSKATVESVLENGNDAIFGAIFWFIIAGAPGVVLFRLANTLDAMWGYRNERFLHFGWAAARLDDVLNFIPARLTALTYTLFGKTRHALNCWKIQAPQWDSPNAGPVMASGAGALGIMLGGPARYEGEMHDRPILGGGELPSTHDIDRALKLINHGLLLWLVILFIGAFIHA
ncbi:MAG: cobalamin biosynthesis protein [Gammaproteobacteria bacterium]|nr:cobalamin biosynthesis protein [Gammaproteobacteria bacterium]